MKGSVYRWAVLALLSFVYLLSFLDRQLLAVLAKPIQADLGLSDGQLGLLGGLYFAVFYCTISVPVGYLADRGNRVRLLAIACALWSVATASCGLARTYVQLALSRTLVGVGEAGGTAPSYSILADYFPAAERGRAFALFSLAVPMGQALGVIFGAGLAVAYGWRHAFFVLGIVGVGASLALSLFVRDPRWRRSERKHVTVANPPSRRTLAKVVRGFLTRRDLLMTALAAAVPTMVNYGMLTFAALLLMREKGMTLRELAQYFGPVLGITMGFGMYASGWYADRYGPRNLQAYAWIPAIALAIAAPFFLAFTAASNWQLALPLLAVPLALNAFYLAPAVTLVQNSVPADERTTSAAMFLLLVNLLGMGLGPTYVGALSDWFHRLHPAHSLQLAFYALAPFYAIAIGMYLALAAVLRKGTATTKAT